MIARSVVRIIVPLLVVLIIIPALSGYNSPAWKNLATEQKLEDFRYLYRMFEENDGTLAMNFVQATVGSKPALTATVFPQASCGSESAFPGR